jgi:hypothetical protein
MARRSPGQLSRQGIALSSNDYYLFLYRNNKRATGPQSRRRIPTTEAQRHREGKHSQFPTRPLEPVSPRLCASVVRIAVFQTAARRHITAKRLTASSKPQNIVHPTTQIPKTPNHDRQKENTKPLTVTPRSTANIRIHIRQSTRQATNLRPTGQPLGHQHNLLSPVRFQSHTLPAKPSVQRGRRPGIKP